MAKRKDKKRVLKPRNPFALHALTRKAARDMKDRREPRKGTKNKQREYLEQAE